MKQHPIEATWLKFRKQNLELIEKVEELYHEYWPITYQNTPKDPLVVIPRGVIEEYYTLKKLATDKNTAPSQIYDKAYKSIVGQLDDETYDFTLKCATLMTYRGDKTIYNIDPVLFESLAKTKFPDKFLTSNLVLPARACVFQVGEDAKQSMIAYFNITTPRPEQGEPERVFDIVQFDHETEVFSLAFSVVIKDGQSLREAINNHIAYFRDRQREISQVRDEYEFYIETENRHLEAYNKFIEQQIHTINGYINCILYASGNDDTVKVVDHKRKTHKDPKKNKRFRDLAKQAQYTMGGLYAKVVKRFNEKYKTSSSTGEGQSKRPHIRAGHSHFYWKNHPTKTGKNAKVPVVYFLPPMPIGYKWDKEKDDFVIAKLK